jgi:N-acyl-D-aspartate/D-glutamate deacylase
VFDPQNVKAMATFEAPHQLAQGFSYVIVNGKLARTDKGVGTSRYGKILKAK